MQKRMLLLVFTKDLGMYSTFLYSLLVELNSHTKQNYKVLMVDGKQLQRYAKDEIR